MLGRLAVHALRRCGWGDGVGLALSLRTVVRVARVVPRRAPLGWDSRFFIDEHADGPRSVFFRVQMLDVDPAQGTILKQIENLRLRLD